MHYKCDDCMKPKMDGVYQDQCGGLSGLSILDAEKLNDIYDCKGEKYVHSNFFDQYLDSQ